MPIKDKEGDILKSKAKLIVQPVNNFGRMNNGLSLAIKNKYIHVYQAYQDLIKDCSIHQMPLLGLMQFVPTDFHKRDIKLGAITYRGQYIVNLFVQYRDENDVIHVDYGALTRALNSLNRKLNMEAFKKCTISMPYNLGCDDEHSPEEFKELVESIMGKRDIEFWRV